jgi:ketosteroid isomerase-like protein
MPEQAPSRLLVIAAGLLTQLIGAGCLVLSLASLPAAHDLHHGTHAAIGAAIAAVAALIVGALAYGSRPVALGLAALIDVGFGIVLPRSDSGLGQVFQMLRSGNGKGADTLITIAAVVMFASGAVCLIAIPSALAVKRWRARPRNTTERTVRTRKGFEPLRASSPTEMVTNGPRKPKGAIWPYIVVGIGVTLVAVGIGAIAASGGGGGGSASGKTAESGSGSAAKRGSGSGTGTGMGTSASAGSGSDSGSGSGSGMAAPGGPDEVIAAFHAALVHIEAGELAGVLAPKLFMFGAEANELGEGREAAIAILRHDLGDPPDGGFGVDAHKLAIGRDGQIAWVAQELGVSADKRPAKKFVSTAVLAEQNGTWSIVAICLAVAVPNEVAYKTARDGTLPAPDAIPNSHDASPLAEAMRRAFASKPAFVDARSARSDAFNFGSAPGERIVGGDAIRKTFAHLKAKLRLHDAVKVGAIGDRAGWGVANVDFTDADRDGTLVTQTFRVLAAWVKEDAGWRIVQTQWSNAR